MDGFRFREPSIFMCSQCGNVPAAESFAVDLHDVQQDFG